MPHPASKNTPQPQASLSPLENTTQSQSGAGATGPAGLPDGVPPLTNAELVQLQIRVIALENLVVALLAHAPEPQLELVRDIAASIFPRPGVEHRLTIQASAQMEHLAQRSQRVQGCLAATSAGMVEDDFQQNQ